MPIALELRGVTKGFVAGTGACTAAARVLHGVDLAVHAGESVAVAGPSGSGKSTVLLCAAGLLRPETGEIEWFGQNDRAVAARRVVYHCTPTRVVTASLLAEPIVHLVDIRVSPDATLRLGRWIERRREQGDAVIVSVCDEDVAHHLASRVVVLRGGRLHPDTRTRSRVAEYARG